MTQVITRFAARGKSAAQMLIMPAFFVILTAIPWLVALQLFVMSVWLRGSGWTRTAAVCKWAALVLGLLLAIGTLIFIVRWLMLLAQVLIRGKRMDEL